MRKDERTVEVHEALKGVVLDLVGGTMRVLASQTIRMEMSTVLVGSGDLWAERIHREVVTPDLAVFGALEDLSFE